MPAITLKRINGLLLGRTPTQTGEIHVVKGRNFMPFLEGPRSYFNARPLNNSPFPDSVKYPAVFPNDGDFIYLSENGVYKLNDDCNLQLLHEFQCKEVERECGDFDYPWSSAFVGDSHFYAHPSVGLIEFDTFTCEWKQHARKALGFSDLIFSITQTAETLIVQSRDTVTWSEFGEGSHLIENEYSGAGSQSTHLAKRGRPLGVYSDGQGWFTFTTKGVMYSRPLSSAQIISGENVEGNAVYRHDRFATDSIPFSPYSIINISDSLIVYLGNKGLTQVGRFDNNQFTSQTFDPVMSRWMRETMFECNPGYLTWGNHRLFYDEGKNWLFLSFSSDRIRTYNESLVYDVELKEWGSFNREHTLIANFPRNSHSLQESRLGYIGNGGYGYAFTTERNHHEAVGGPARVESVDSFIDVGYIRADDPEENERYSSLDGFTIETRECQTNFEVEVFGASGECDYENECESETPYLHSTENCAHYYAFTNHGTVHIIRVKATELNESYWVKLLRLNLKLRGKV